MAKSKSYGGLVFLLAVLAAGGGGGGITSKNDRQEARVPIRQGRARRHRPDRYGHGRPSAGGHVDIGAQVCQIKEVRVDFNPS